MTAIPKNAPTRLSAHKMRQLNEGVLERDNYTCQDCGTMQNIDPPHHIIHKSQGGSDTAENLVTLCRCCHGKRHGINYFFDGYIPF